MGEPIILKDTLKLLIPNRDKNGKYINPKPVVQFLTEQAVNLFGGYQQATVNGGYKNSSDEITLEKVYVVEICFNSEQLAEFSMIVSTFIILLSRVLNQETAGYKVNSKLILVPTDTSDINLNHNLNASRN